MKSQKGRTQEKDHTENIKKRAWQDLAKELEPSAQKSVVMQKLKAELIQLGVIPNKRLR